jgi:lysyl-tRNA synthetase class I
VQAPFREHTTLDIFASSLHAMRFYLSFVAGGAKRSIFILYDLDVFHKVPANVPAEWNQYLGRPLCDVPSPDDASNRSYTGYFFEGMIESCTMNLYLHLVLNILKYS